MWCVRYVTSRDIIDKHVTDRTVFNENVLLFTRLFAELLGARYFGLVQHKFSASVYFF